MVAVLFARADSVYKALDGCDVWDIERDARRWPGGSPEQLARWLVELAASCGQVQRMAA
jgi:hypothetical protein